MINRIDKSGKFKKPFLSIVLLVMGVFAWAYSRPLVTDINAVVGTGTSINVMWNLPQNLQKPVTRLVVYRDTKPISDYSAVKKLKPVAELAPTKTAWTDSVSDFTDYYYAVVCVTDKAYDIIMPSINATVRGVHLKGTKISNAQVITREEKSYPAGTLRETPLPYLDLLDDKKSNELTISKEVSLEAQKLGIPVQRKTVLLSPYIFENELVEPDGGDDYLLFDILSRTLIQKKYVEGIAEINRLLGTNVSEGVLTRAQFYLGECQYFATDFESSVRSFVRVQSVYPDLAAKWISSALDNITISK